MVSACYENILVPSSSLEYHNYTFFFLQFQITHTIRLYPIPPDPNAPSTTNTTSSAGKDDPHAPVVAETYDEVVFTNPTETFFEQLRQVPLAPSVEYSHAEHLGQFSDAADFLALVEAQKFIAQELDALKERMDVVNGEMEETDIELRDAQEKAKAAAASQRRSAKAGRGTPAAAATPANKKAKTATGSAAKK